ncbi:unnamed protein product [Mortierella alpina]
MRLETVPEAEAPACYDYSSIDTWFPIEKCVRELFRVDLLKADAVKQLFALDTSTFSDVHAYAGKVELLMEASGLKDSAYETLVLESLYAGLLDEGQKAITVKYPKLADLPNVAVFLDCLRADSTQFPGRKTDWAKWFKARFKPLESAGQESMTTAIADGKKPAAVQQPNKGKHPRKEARQPCSKEKCTSGLHTPAQRYIMHPVCNIHQSPLVVVQRSNLVKRQRSKVTLVQ